MVTESQKPIVPVVLRVLQYLEDGIDDEEEWGVDLWNLFAIFPTLPGEFDGHYRGCCLGYGCAEELMPVDYHHCIETSRPATVEESAPLVDNMKHVLEDYRFRTVSRASPQMHVIRNSAALELRRVWKQREQEQIVARSQGPIVPVMFRVWQEEKGKDDDEVSALFPTLPSDLHGRYCRTYTLALGHSTTDYYGFIKTSRPATIKESASLVAELKRLGYRLRVVKQVSSKMHKARRLAARKNRLTETAKTRNE